jgi:BirA family biotin operon repressor/biotin-[acetyl-CoA-carboxylase] ligase
MGRSFYSPKDSGLYMTALFEANESLVSTVLMTTSAAVAAARSIEALSGIKVEIKWVNDLYLNEKKICGILCEAFEACGRRFICIGIGINLFTKDFPEELAAIAGSLGVERDIKDELAARVFCELWRSYHTDERGDMLAYYKEHSLVIGKPIYFIEDGKKHFGVARDIDEFGHLCVTLEDGSEKILSSGEITLRLDKGE